MTRDAHTSTTRIRQGTTPARIRIVVVDDEPLIRELVVTVLRYEGYDVQSCESGTEAMRLVDDFDPQLLILDVMLPDLDGFEVHERLRQLGRQTPVIFLTARDAVEDRVRGLVTGGDDYITKPFSLEEFVARVQAVLRRQQGEQPQTRMAFRDLEIDEERHEVRRAGEAIDITPTEFKLLRFLMRHPGRALTRAQILDHVWEYDFGGESNIVESYISSLRRKVDAGRQPLIHTVWGVGYSLREPKPA
jgi:two-component system, OmpR family, response regulator